MRENLSIGAVLICDVKGIDRHVTLGFIADGRAAFTRQYGKICWSTTDSII